MNERELFVRGTNKYIERIKREQEIYLEVLDSIPSDYQEKFIKLNPEIYLIR